MHTYSIIYSNIHFKNTFTKGLVNWFERKPLHHFIDKSLYTLKCNLYAYKGSLTEIFTEYISQE